jgi:hypothetical protein
MRRIMRRVVFIALLGAAAAAAAQAPPRLEPLPEPPPPPPGVRDIGADEPRVRIAPQEGDVVEEVRHNGRVVIMKVTPPGGVPYYLIDTTGNGNWMRRDSLDDGVRVPMWTIWTFD